MSAFLLSYVLLSVLLAHLLFCLRSLQPGSWFYHIYEASHQKVTAALLTGKSNEDFSAFHFFNFSGSQDHRSSFLKFSAVLSFKIVYIPGPPSTSLTFFLCLVHGLSFHPLSFHCLIHDSWPHLVYTPPGGLHPYSVVCILMTLNMYVQSRNLPQLHIHTSNHG